jgi:hypothetical protein
MLKFTIIAGLNDKDTKKQEITTENAIGKIVEVLKLAKVEGATLTEAKGLYIHEDGTAVFENSIKIELLFITEETAKEICKLLKTVLNQEAVVLEITALNSNLI